MTDPVTGSLLDAARECVLTFGVSRTTLTEVARRSGRSRPTIYSRWPDARSLIADLLTRELLEVITGTTGDAPAGAPVRERLVSGLVAIAARLRENPLLRKIIEVDPELLGPYLLRGLGTSQLTILDMLTGWLSDGIADGSVRAGDERGRAGLLLLVMQGAVLSGPLLADRLPPARLDRELAELLEGYLRP